MPLVWLSAVLLSFFALQVYSQKGSSPESQTRQTSTDIPKSEATPIPLSNIITQADSDAKKLEIIRSEIAANPEMLSIGQELPGLSKELNTRVSETQGILLAHPSLETLRSLEEDWQAFAKSMVRWRSNLKTASDDLNKKLDELKSLLTLWQETLNNIKKLKSSDTENDEIPEQVESTEQESKGVEIPLEVIEKIQFTIDEIKKTQKSVEKESAELLTLQTLVSEQAEKIENQQKSVK